MARIQDSSYFNMIGYFWYILRIPQKCYKITPTVAGVSNRRKSTGKYK